MGFQNENKLKVGASVKATINNKVVEAKVISVGFNRVTLRSEKGNEASYVFNSDKFLKWFNKVPLTEHMRLHAENEKANILDGVKVVTSGPSVKDRTSTPKEKESKYKLGFDFDDKSETSFLLMADLYSNEERKKRLSVLFVPMFMLYGTNGFQFSMVVIHALSYVADLKHHSDLEWNTMIENRNIDEAFFESFDDMSIADLTLFIHVIEAYAKKLERAEGKGDNGYGVTLEEWARFLPKNQKEAKFVAQLLCDGGINKYNLSCAGLTANLLADNLWSYGLRDEDYDDEGNVIAPENENEAENLEN
ncbi:hypothetical protein [Helicobacter pylori]|uniref:HP0423 family protein n=1 Tax=Helicobacter pylori Hp P-2 TaxID=992073 RepID=I9W520_HELPX|nr:hypothetical protein [Helicobacter pylori]EJB99124.1 hypothetical protein HPHPP2_1237 [Helicobacter pylori Hp P-2]EJC56824.1 hypothetical protein HPHPP2B_1270 [Helicobacter pylori Hp P-2b]